jgi:hypothetical protein
MRRLKTKAIIDLDDNVGDWNTSSDRWGRNAKHHVSQNEIAAMTEDGMFDLNETVLHEGREATMEIPDGPRGMVGIRQDGALRMVHSSRVSKIVEEGVMGGVMAMPAINRMMQLAGLEHTGAVSTETSDTVALEEDAASMMIDNLAKQASNMGQFKDRPEAAKLYALGSVLSALHKSASGTTFNSTEALAKKNELDALGVFGADLIKTAQDMAAKAASTQAASRTAAVGTSEE